jgi:hypothetical protein
VDAGDDIVLPDAAPPAPGGQGSVVSYYFPVEVEVVGDADETLVKRIAAEVFAEFDRELESRQ